MNDVWFGPGLTRDDFDAFLDALALDRRNGPPLLAVATGDSPGPRLVMASYAFFALFDVTGSEALSRRLLGGRDPGARRLGDLFRSLPMEGAPRLERLRFTIGPASEVITFLCRRFKTAAGLPVFVAAALGVRPGLMPVTPAAPADASEAAHGDAEPSSSFDAPMNVQAIHEALADRWPSTQRLRFLWQSDADGICRDISAPLAAIVGAGNGDLVGKSLPELAPKLDPSGRLAEALAGRVTWSGLDVDWPITDAPGAVGVGLGAVPAFGPDRAFEGFRGYGVIHLDKIVPRQPMRLVPAPEGPRGPGNVVLFPGAQKGFSSEDHAAFAALAAELRDRAGLVEEPAAPEPVPEPETLVPAAVAPEPAPLEAVEHPAADVSAPVAEAPAAEAPAAVPPPVGLMPTPAPAHPSDNALAMLDRLALGLLVSRDNVPIFANRHFLDLSGFKDEDELHEAGGLARLFSATPHEDRGCESVAVRRRDGTILPASARMQRIDWDGLPATLLTLQAAPDTKAATSLETEHDAAIEAMGRQHAEDRRRDGAELRHLRAILETATDGVVVIDKAGDVLSLNRSGEALLGRDRGMVIGKPFLDLFAQGNRNLAKDYLDGLTTNATRSLLNDGRELEVGAPQGGTIPVFMTLGRLDHAEPNDDGSATGDARYCALFRDLTHWKKVEHELETAKHDAEAASAAKTDFLAKVSHEVRTPLNAIIGFAEVMREERFGPVGNERYKDYLRDIHSSGTHVMSLINDLLDLSKIEAGRMELDPTPIDANRIISDCVGLMQTQASRGRVIMRMSLAPALPMIKADERSMRQIVLNLLSNAVKYNEPGGQVIVATAAPEDGKVVIRVRDTGAGMSEADIAAALEPFRQLSTRPMTTEGTGLGLPLTKALVEANEATFTIRSKVDQGTLVEVAFPPARVLAGQR